MKYKANESFKPIEIVLTLETQKEVDAFYAIFNYCPFLEAAEKAGLRFGEVRFLVRPENQSEAFRTFEKALSK